MKFMSTTERGDGFILNLLSALEEMYLKTKISYPALRNCIASIEADKEDACNLVRYMDNMKQYGLIEHLSHGLSESGIISYNTWSFKG